MAKPCLVCGTPTFGNRCPQHRPTDNRDRTNNPRRKHAARWHRLSQRLRKQSPQCEQCGTDEDLTVDHIIPVSEDPTLAFKVANLRVLCRSCNSSRGNHATDTEREAVYARLRHQPTRQAADQGKHPENTSTRPHVKPQNAIHTSGGAA